MSDERQELIEVAKKVQEKIGFSSVLDPVKTNEKGEPQYRSVTHFCSSQFAQETKEAELLRDLSNAVIDLKEASDNGY